jgi:hypothetical protein
VGYVQRLSILDARRPALLIAAVAVLAATGCAGSSSSSSGGSEPTARQPPSSSGATTGSYVPAAGTDPSGAIFQTYTNHKLRYQMLYPGGWNVTEKGGIVRIAKLGNSIVIATRKSKNAPKVKPVRAALVNAFDAELGLRVDPDVLDREALPRAGYKATRVIDA